MARIRNKKVFKTMKRGSRRLRRGMVQVGIEASSIVAYGGRELVGLSHHKPKCTLKKGWFE